jgi:ParB family chromosome partitioning protein
MSDKDGEIAALHENSFRSDISAEDEASFLADLIQRRKISQAALAKLIGRSVGYVSERLSVLKWPEPLRVGLREGKISFSAARELAGVADPKQRDCYIEFGLRTGVSPETAARWRQDAQLAAEGHAEPVTPDHLPTPATNLAASQTPCWGCEAPFPLNSTVLVRMCGGCADSCRGVAAAKK